MKNICLSLLMLCTTGLTGNAWAAFSYDPFLTWKTLYSENFHIHFHDGSEELAKKVMRIAERTHVHIVKEFNWAPAEPTEIIINDRVDFTNGAATPVYKNTMYLYMTPPDEINTLEDYDDWLDLLITHEYTHIVHLDKARAGSRVFRAIFGRAPAGFPAFAIFPNAFQPLFYIEGLATYMETDNEKGVGRGQSSTYQMMMRMETLAGIKSLRNINQPITTWPAGTTRYLYGVYFWNFIADTYGKERIPAWVEKYSGHVIPWALNHTSHRILGEDLDIVWEKFEKYLQAKFQPQQQAVLRKGLVAGEQVTNDGYYTGHARYAPNGDIYYVRDDFRDDSYLMVRRKGEHRTRSVARVDGNRFDIHPTEGIVLTQLNIVSNTEIYSDIYHVDTRDHNVKRLTRGGRYRSATWSPDGKRIIAIHNEAGNSGIHLLDRWGKLREVLWQGTNMEVVGEPDWSPDGKWLVAPVWRNENRWDLELFSIAEKKWRKLTQDDNIKMNPLFTQDGKSVVFSADYGGIYNAHIMNLETRQISQLTNVVGGAFFPSLDSDQKKLVYTGFTDKGYDVFHLDLNNNKPLVPAAALPQATDKRNFQASEPTPVYHIEPYSPWHTIRPRWWLPVVEVTENRTTLGVMTAASDSLNRHNYFLAPAYDLNNHYHEGTVAYIYDRFTPAFRFIANRSIDETYQEDPNDRKKEVFERITSNDFISAELIFPILDFNYQWGLHLGAVYNLEQEQKTGNYTTTQPDAKDTLSGAAITYNSAKRFPISISRSGGRSFKVIGEDSDFGDGDYAGKVIIGDWKEYFRLGGEHVLALRLAGGHGMESPRPFQLGGTFSEDYGIPLAESANTLFNKRDFALRGYKDNLAGLRGSKMILTSMEYRFPVFRLERGVTAPPIGLDQIHSKVFINGGEAWNTDADRESLRWGAGFEFHFDLIFGYAGLLDFRAGTAWGFDQGAKKHQFYLTLGTSF